MDATALGTQFCLQLAFGLLFGLAFVRSAPVGAFFYRLMGTTALVPALAALALQVLADPAAWSSPSVLAAAPAVLAFPWYASSARKRSWRAALGLALAGLALALHFELEGTSNGAGPVRLLLLASVLATGAVAGGVGLAMVLGHWYLTIPKLDVAHLRRLNRVTVASMLVSLALVGLTLVWFRAPLGAAEPALFGPWGLFHLGTRLAVGLLLPLVFAWMAHDSLRFQNTRSATGILYASTVLVLIGTAVSASLQSSYGVPL